MFPGTYDAGIFAKRTPRALARLAGLIERLKSAAHHCDPSTVFARISPSLSTQFLVAAALVLCFALTALGIGISSAIETVVIHNTASSTALYVQSLIEPALQSMGQTQLLEPSVQRDLDRILLTTPLGKSIATIKIWNLDGTIVYSTNHALHGSSYPQTKGFLDARQERIAVEFDDLNEDEDAPERLLNRPLLEVYVPVHHLASNSSSLSPNSTSTAMV